MNPYGVTTSESNLLGPLTSLKILYEKMPATKGCERCAEINGDDKKDWCCLSQSPSMYYVEFLYSFMDVQAWAEEKRTELILRAVRNYLDGSINKPCIHYDNGCQVYDKRPLICRLYGIIPEKRFQERWEILKERQGDRFETNPQCTLVSSEKKITQEDEDKWFAWTRKAESRILVNPDAIAAHDLPGGSYRTFHDHLLIELFPPAFLEYLTKVRMTNPTQADIDLTMDVIKQQLVMHPEGCEDRNESIDNGSKTTIEMP